MCRVINADKAEGGGRVCAKSAGHAVSGSRDAVAGDGGLRLGAGVGGCDRQCAIRHARAS